jgi:alkaline phosphatase
MSHQKHRIVLNCALIIVSWSLVAQAAKNVIVMVMDGCGTTHTTVSRWVKGSPLAIDEMLVGGIRTYNSVSIITDSAPAATAFACGIKSSDGAIGVFPEKVTIPGVSPISPEMKLKPAASVLEGAKLTGRSTGLIATSNIQHATPAGYSAHWPDRDNFTEIGRQQVLLGIDVVFGGGKQYLLPKNLKGVRTDDLNLIDVLTKNNYKLIETREELMKLTPQTQKVWGMFADDAMANDLDRPVLRPSEPTLAEMTRKAIEILSKNKKGFFLMVEGSKIDWSSHAHDSVGVVTEMLAFDRAVKESLDFAKKDGDTLILVFSDHGNGGMSIGTDASPVKYSKTPLDTLIAPIKRAKFTVEGVLATIGDNTSKEHIRTVLETCFGLKDVTDTEISDIQNADKGKARMNTITDIFNRRTIIGWTTHGHTGEDLDLYAFGPDKPTGLIENTEIAHACARAMGFDLADVTQKLFGQPEKKTRRETSSEKFTCGGSSKMCIIK